MNRWAGTTLSRYKWTVCRKSSGKFRPWTVFDPAHFCDDNDQQWPFATFAEAIAFAQREAFKERLVGDFTGYLDVNQNRTSSPDLDHTGLDTMCRVFRWWGQYDLAGFLENV